MESLPLLYQKVSTLHIVLGLARVIFAFTSITIIISAQPDWILLQAKGLKSLGGMFLGKSMKQKIWRGQKGRRKMFGFQPVMNWIRGLMRGFAERLSHLYVYQKVAPGKLERIKLPGTVFSRSIRTFAAQGLLIRALL